MTLQTCGHSDPACRLRVVQPRWYITTIMATCFALCANDLNARSPVARQRRAPAVPEAAYHPIPGPFLAVVDKNGDPKDFGVISNATMSWAGPKLSAFRLCFQPASTAIDWSHAFDALERVSMVLKARGAAVVVVDAGRICETPPSSTMTNAAHVEIRGMIRG